MSDLNVPYDNGIYAKSSGVSAVVADNIADYGGAAGLTITHEKIEWRGQSMYVQQQQLISIGASFNFATVLLKPATFGTLYGLSWATGSTLESSWATASIWEFNESLSTVPSLEFLIDTIRSSDGKHLQFWLAAGNIAGDMPLNLAPREWETHDISVVGYTNTNDQLLQIIKEV